MRHEGIKLLHPAPLDGEMLGGLDKLGEIADAIDLAALAVMGMADELGGAEGQLIANHLRDQAEMIRRAIERLVPQSEPQHPSVSCKSKPWAKS